jgi:hypothetical protein
LKTSLNPGNPDQSREQPKRPVAGARPSPSFWMIAALAGFGLLALYMLSPALTSTHPEGFTGLIQLDAIAANQHLLDRADLTYPVQVEYFYMTRQGVVLLLRGLMDLTGTTGDSLFRMLTIVSFAVFLATTALVARRHSALSWPAILGSMLLIPGVFELGFYFSDNVVSVAFGMLGAALLPAPSGLAPPPGAARVSAGWVARGLLAGGALAMAMLCRTDSLLLLLLAAGLMWLDQQPWQRFILLGVAVGAGLLAVLALSWAISGTTIFQAVEIGQFFDHLHGGARSKLIQASIFGLFFGPAGLLLVAIGVTRSVKEETWQRLFVLCVLPIPVLLVALRGATELRQIYPLLAPFIVVQCGLGIEWVWAALQSENRNRTRLAHAIVAATVLAWVLPPIFVPVRDGPRALVGRIWSPPMWLSWQAMVNKSLGDADLLLAKAGQVPRLVAVTNHFNSDHYLQLRAWQNGWRPLRDTETKDHCPGSQIWSKDGHELVQVRLEDPYSIVQLTFEQFIALQLSQALKCPAVVGGAPVYISDFSRALSDAPLSESLRTSVPKQDKARPTFGWPAMAAGRIEAVMNRSAKLRWAIPLEFGMNYIAPLSPEQLATARAMAVRDVQADRVTPDGSPYPDFKDYLSQFHTRFWKIPPEDGSAKVGG